jgi:formylglycine-generating enzyme required for sulfatase activity
MAIGLEARRVAFSKWSRAGYGRELNWLGRGVQDTLELAGVRNHNTVSARIIGASVDIAARIGIRFIKIDEAGESFIYQGTSATVPETYWLAATQFTHGQLAALRYVLREAGRENDLLSIFSTPDFSYDKVMKGSLAIVAKDVAERRKQDCPLVWVSQIESAALAQLLGVELPTDRQWERAASFTDGRKRPWGADLSPDKAVYYYQEGIASGTRPVKSKPAGKSQEGIFGLIGNVWEWTKEGFLRGGSWRNNDESCLQADYRFGIVRPDCLNVNIGIRFSRTEKK